MSLIQVPVSYGELIDKLTILEIKSARMSDPAKLANVRHELELLDATWRQAPAAALRWGAKLELPGVMDLIEVADVTATLDRLLAARGKDARH